MRVGRWGSILLDAHEEFVTITLPGGGIAQDHLQSAGDHCLETVQHLTSNIGILLSSIEEIIDGLIDTRISL